MAPNEAQKQLLVGWAKVQGETRAEKPRFTISILVMMRLSLIKVRDFGN